MLQAHTFCSFCGAEFPPDASWPRVCARCGQLTYRNPLPVSVVLVPVARVNGGGVGLLVVRRGIEPGAGKLALPGGYINFGETWQLAGAREVLEETGLALDPSEIREIGVRSAPDGTLIVFGQASEHPEEALPPFEPNPESLERVVLGGPARMAFPLHTQMVERFFQG